MEEEGRGVNGEGGGGEEIPPGTHFCSKVFVSENTGKLTASSHSMVFLSVLLGETASFLIPTHLVLLRCRSLRFTGVAFLTNGRQGPLPAKTF